MRTYKHILTGCLMVALAGGAMAQETTTFSLEDAEQYGVNNNEKVKNALLDLEIARKQVWETTAIGLPQVNIDQFPGFGSARESGLRGHFFDILWMADETMIFQRLQGWPPCCRG